MNKPYLSNQVSVGLTDQEFDTLCSEAERAGVTRSEYIRRALRLGGPVRPRNDLGIVAYVGDQPYGCVYRASLSSERILDNCQTVETEFGNMGVYVSPNAKKQGARSNGC